MGLTESNPGTYSSDTECGNPHTAVAIISVVTLILSVFAVILILKKKQSQKSGKQCLIW